MLNTPIFGAAGPQSFFDQMLALKPGPVTGKPDPERIAAYKAGYPDNFAQSQYLAANNPPASYANSAYWGIPAFNFIDRKNKASAVRWRFVPQDGEKPLSNEVQKAAPASFLEQDLVSRVQQVPVRRDMPVTFGDASDPENNPTLAWPGRPAARRSSWAR